MKPTVDDLNLHSITFEVTASTNVPAAKIIIHREGGVDYFIAGNQSPESQEKPQAESQEKSYNECKIDRAVMDRIFKSISAVWPINSSRKFAIKSASFGHCSYITYMGSKSPDLDTCVQNETVKDLAVDLNGILDSARKFYKNL